jgi:hypothetical protein
MSKKNHAIVCPSGFGFLVGPEHIERQDALLVIREYDASRSPLTYEEYDCVLLVLGKPRHFLSVSFGD